MGLWRPPPWGAAAGWSMMPAMILTSAFAWIDARRPSALPSRWELVDYLAVWSSDVPVRRRLSIGSLVHADRIRVSVRTNSSVIDADLHHVDWWADGAVLTVNRAGTSSHPQLPRLATFRGRLANASHLGAASAVVLHDGRMLYVRMHIHQGNGRITTLESAGRCRLGRRD